LSAHACASAAIVADHTRGGKGVAAAGDTLARAKLCAAVMPVMAVGSEEADEEEGTAVGVGRKEGFVEVEMDVGEVVGLLEVVGGVVEEAVVAMVGGRDSLEVGDGVGDTEGLVVVEMAVVGLKVVGGVVVVKIIGVGFEEMEDGGDGVGGEERKEGAVVTAMVGGVVEEAVS